VDRNFHIDLLADPQLAVCRPIGPLTGDRISQLFYFLLGAEKASKGPFDRLLDLTGVTEFPFGAAVVHGYASLRKEVLVESVPARTAIIAPQSDAEIVAGLYAALMEESKIAVKVFRDAAGATTWLGVPENILEKCTEAQRV
jgi:hypothetical protein